jgi:hypothetical protein
MAQISWNLTDAEDGFLVPKTVSWCKTVAYI